MKQAYLFFFVLILLSSCHKDNGSAIGSGSVIVINEGGYGHGDADISVYDPATHAVSNNIFKAENGFSLGDVAQSLYLIGDTTAFIVMNNSARVVVANAKNNFKYQYSINIAGSFPRFFLPVDSSKAYVTELYNNNIYVVNYKTGALLRTIAVSGSTEQMVAWGGKVYVAEASKPYLGTGPVPTSVHAILEIDPTTDQIVHTVNLASDPNSMTLVQNSLYVLTSSDTPSVKASIYNIDIASLSVNSKTDFAAGHNPNFLRYSAPANQLLYSDSGGIYAMSPTASLVPTAPFIASNNWNVYGLNADPVSGDIYISDAVDYQQASHIMRYSQTGSALDHFTAGIITNGFVFK